MKFPSGFQRFMESFHSRTLTFQIFKLLSSIAFCFGILWFASVWGNLPEEVNFVSTLGTIIFTIMAAAELIVQCVEQLADRLSQESNYYWAGIVIIATILANFNHDLIDYILLFFSVMLVRWFIFGLVNIFITNR